MAALAGGAQREAVRNDEGEDTHGDGEQQHDPRLGRREEDEQEAEQQRRREREGQPPARDGYSERARRVWLREAQQEQREELEGGGAAVLGSIQPQPIENEADGSLCLDKVKAAIKADDFHFAKTKLVSLENTIGGQVLSLEYLSKAREFVDAHKLALHLDGARVYNAAAKLGVDITRITGHFDSVSVCLSKGLGAPVGSVLLGSEVLVAKARRWRKVLGGGMRQAGMLAAAGQYVLEHNTKRLSDDHDNALYLAMQLNTLSGFNVELNSVETNIVYVNVDANIDLAAMCQRLATRNILFSPGTPLRLVTHLGITKESVNTFIQALAAEI